MPNLVAIDVFVIDNRIRLVFSHRAVAAAYAAYLRAEDLRPPHQQAIPGYQRSPQLHSATREVSLSLPGFITWFITCRQPDDEDSVTFTFMDADEARANRWAESMVLFERVPGHCCPQHYGHGHDHDHDRRHQQNHSLHEDNSDDDDDDDDVDDDYDDCTKQLYVRRLWNKDRLLKRLEELRRRAHSAAATPATGRSRRTSPTFAGDGSGRGDAGGGGSGSGSPATGGHGLINGRVPVPVPITVPAGRDIWW